MTDDILGLTAVLVLGWMLDNPRRPECSTPAVDTSPRRRHIAPTYDINAVNDTVTLPQLLARQREKQ